MSKTISIASLSALLLLASNTPAPAQVCGDTIGPNETVTLTADIGPCTDSVSAALTIIGPAKVDLNGHQIQCDSTSPSNGVDVLGSGAYVSGGSIRGCDAYSLRVGGTGKHSVTSIAIKGGVDSGKGVEVLTGSDLNRLTDIVVTNSGTGFHIFGNKGKLSGLTASSSDDEGIILEGSSNKVTRMTAVNSTKEGIIVNGSNNKIQDCEAVTSGNGGIVLNGANNSLKDCSAIRGLGDGFEVNGAGNSISAAESDNNGQRGYDIFGDATRLSDSTAVNNGGDGVLLQEAASTVTGVRSIGNGGNGIQVDAGNVHSISRSVALESGGTHDIRDNTNCAGATWNDNTFRSANDPCIQ